MFFRMIGINNNEFQFVFQRTDISQYTKADATRSRAQIIMTNTGNPFFQYKD
ncbi:hypothetical protein T11_13173 [Trichinella zimbabwensis]|uniref:Uncharacterized protein n=1 Tax=Trichinella zimbabwensis TaxID=268475 RepID=A0A0V1G6S7_9BILA|nr:hypothetical protein T11_13173 [Trichinella zimbabwensis]